MMRAGRHVILVWIGSSMLYACHLFPGAYVHMMHRCASYLGHWTKIEGRVSPNFYNLWTGHIFWPQSHIVRYGKGNDLFKAEGVANAAEPGDEGQVKFYVSITLVVIRYHIRIDSYHSDLLPRLEHLQLRPGGDAIRIDPGPARVPHLHHRVVLDHLRGHHALCQLLRHVQSTP